MGKHNAEDPPKRWRRVVMWCCLEGRHIAIELPAGLGAILLYEFFLSPHGKENLEYFTNVLTL